MRSIIKHITIIAAILMSLSCYAQTYQIFENDTINRIDRNSLKYGRWLDYTYDKDSLNTWLSEEGFYKIVDLKDSTFLDSYRHSSYSELYFKNNESAFYCAARYRTLYSVRDGYWISYLDYERNKIKRIDLYKDGIELQSKYFDEGILSRVDVDRFLNGRKVEDVYTDGSSYLFKRNFWARTDNEADKELFYPDSPLNLSDSEIRFITALSHTDSSVIKIISNYGQEIVIDSIVSTSRQIKPIIQQLKINPADTSEIKILYTPDRYDLRKTDTVSIYTSVFPYRYNIFITLSAYDLGYYNAKIVDDIELKRVTGRPLIFYVCDLCWHSSVEIKNSRNKLKDTFFLNEGVCKKLDISGYKRGEYNIHVKTGCDNFYDYKLIIK